MRSLTEILQRQAVWRGGALAHARVVPSGFVTLDRELPGGGWPAGALSEVLVSDEGIGELQLVLPALGALSAQGRRLAWLAPPHLPYAPALAAAGVRLEFLTVIRAPGKRDALWAAEQALRAGVFHGLLAWFGRACYAELRRLAVAAERTPGFAVVFRSREAACESSPACLRLALEPLSGAEPDRLAVRILKRRGAPVGSPLRIPIERPVHAVAGALPAFARARSEVARSCAV
jgi:cell division inhibitor SulA/protein ImuA